MKLSPVFVVLVALLAAVGVTFTFFNIAAVTTAVGGTFYHADDKIFAYSGRWHLNPEERVARADWPCSGVKFSVSTGGTSPIALRLNMNIRRLRVKVLVTDPTGAVESETILQGGAIDFEKNYEIMFENKNAGTYTVSLTKLTQASPFGNGLGKLLTSAIEFYGVEIDSNKATLESPPLPSRRVTFIGASDTAGFCVDGTPKTKDGAMRPWKYDNCDMTSPGELGRRLDAEISVQAMAGIGITQNAYGDKPMLLGGDTMPDYYSRTLQTKAQHAWNFQERRPGLVIVSLGGNDFNHQKAVPSNTTFSAAYEEFLLQIADPYLEDDEPPTIVSVCGQGDPTEVERDPNNDRCRPCPHVKDATESFRAKYSETIRVEFIFIPCDGSVVTGDGDIGCEGHKNRLGQKRVADFLEPRLREIMAWSNQTDPGKL